MPSGQELITRVCEMAKMNATFTGAAPSDVTQEDNSGASFVDETADAGDIGANDVDVPDPFDTDDALYIGYSSTFSTLNINVSTAGVGDDVTGETVWEYYNGSSWEQVTDLEDLTAGFTVSGTNTVSFVAGSDWTATTVDSGSSLYFLRFRATADDVYNTTQMQIRQIEVSAPSDDRVRVRSYLQEAADLVCEQVGLDVSAEASVSLTASQAEYTMDASPFPTDMVRVISMRMTDASSTNLPLRQVSLEEIDSMRVGSQADSAPLYYAAEYPTLVLYPAPDASTTLGVRYISEAPNIVDSQASISFIPRAYQWSVLQEYAMYRAMQYKKNEELAQQHLEAYAFGLRQLKKWKSKAAGRNLSRQARVSKLRTSPSQDWG